jgi:hypothetical protein
MVVLDEAETDAYQLASAKGHILHNFINIARVRNLNVDERKPILFPTKPKNGIGTSQRFMRGVDVGS